MISALSRWSNQHHIYTTCMHRTKITSSLFSLFTAADADAALPLQGNLLSAEGVSVDRGVPVPSQGWRVQDSQCVSGMRYGRAVPCCAMYCYSIIIIIIIIITRDGIQRSEFLRLLVLVRLISK